MKLGAIRFCISRLTIIFRLQRQYGGSKITQSLFFSFLFLDHQRHNLLTSNWCHFFNHCPVFSTGDEILRSKKPVRLKNRFFLYWLFGRLINQNRWFKSLVFVNETICHIIITSQSLKITRKIMIHPQNQFFTTDSTVQHRKSQHESPNPPLHSETQSPSTIHPLASTRWRRR